MYQQPMQGYAPQMQMQQPASGEMSVGVKILIGAVVAGLLYLAYTTMSKPAVVPPAGGGYNGPTGALTGGSAGSSGGSSGSSAGSYVPPAAAAPVVVQKQWKYKGCYNDDGNRTIKDMLGNMDYNSCVSGVTAKGYNVFGLQYHDGQPGTQNSECWGGKDSVYDALGPAGNCTFNDSAGHVHGSAWSNAVYKLE